MCPECFAGLALLVTGVVSSGGAAALAAKLFHSKKSPAKISEVQISKVKENTK